MRFCEPNAEIIVSLALLPGACTIRLTSCPPRRIDISRYELKTEQDEATGALVITLVERPPDAEPPSAEPPAPGRPHLEVISR